MAFPATIYQALHEMSFPPATLSESKAVGAQLGALWWPGWVEWKGRPRRRRYMYTQADSLHCTAETNTTLWSNYTPIKNIMRKREMRPLALQGSRHLPCLDSSSSSGRAWLPSRFSFRWWNHFSQPSPGTANHNKYKVDWKVKCKTCNQNMLE